MAGYNDSSVFISLLGDASAGMSDEARLEPKVSHKILIGFYGFDICGIEVE
jgi:hypothetical protein